MDKQHSPEELSKLKEIFSLFDTKNVGVITSRDLCICLKSLGYNPTEAESQDLIMKASPDGNGYLRFPEFVSMMSGKQEAVDSDAELKETFHVFDSNGSGFIGADELMRVMASLGEEITEEEAVELIRTVNPNGHDDLDYEQFLMLISSQPVTGKI